MVNVVMKIQIAILNNHIVFMVVLKLYFLWKRKEQYIKTVTCFLIVPSHWSGVPTTVLRRWKMVQERAKDAISVVKAQ